MTLDIAITDPKALSPRPATTSAWQWHLLWRDVNRVWRYTIKGFKFNVGIYDTFKWLDIKIAVIYLEGPD